MSTLAQPFLTNALLRSSKTLLSRIPISTRTTRTMSTSTSPFPPPSLTPIIGKVSTHLKSASKTLCLAETATGGLLSSSLLSVPGASSFYRGGLTLYTLPSRLAYGGWTQSDIDSYKGPTTDIVAGLAKKVRQDLDADFCLAESGTAGPTGGKSRNRTPGYVALAVADREGRVWTREVETGTGERVENMLRFAEEGAKLLVEVLEGKVDAEATAAEKL